MRSKNGANFELILYNFVQQINIIQTNSVLYLQRKIKI